MSNSQTLALTADVARREDLPRQTAEPRRADPAPGASRDASPARRSLWTRVVSWLSFRAGRLATAAERRELARRMERRGAGVAASIPTWTTWRELSTLHRLASECTPGAMAVEVGSYLGASSCYIAAGLMDRGGRLVCVDTWNNDNVPPAPIDTFADFEKNVAAVRGSITTVRKRSVDLEVSDLPPGGFELVFLDGDHLYDAVSFEMRFFSPLIKEGGVLAFHDAIEFEGIARAIGEAMASGHWQFGGHLDNLIWLKKTRWADPTYNEPAPA
jgi:predicted O-methyltransferase YrrM